MRIQLDDYKGFCIMGHRGHWEVCKMWEGGLLAMLKDTPGKLPKRLVLKTLTTKAAAKKFVDEMVRAGKLYDTVMESHNAKT